MWLSETTIENSNKQDLKNIKNLIFDLLDSPLSDDINKVVECNKYSQICKHYLTHQEFSEFSSEEIKNKLKIYIRRVNKTMSLLESDVSLYLFVKRIMMRFKAIELYVKAYKYDEWHFVDTAVEIEAKALDRYLTMMYSTICDELEKRWKTNE
ncbi:hypothetical protein MFE_04940 [Mycoplasmopsis fermentans JER]|nr:hypothetical protein MFE_04940 [Mycoplasmopsis fermentans JER]